MHRHSKLKAQNLEFNTIMIRFISQIAANKKRCKISKNF